jgi:hypothetical protein
VRSGYSWANGTIISSQEYQASRLDCLHGLLPLGLRGGVGGGIIVAAVGLLRSTKDYG